MAATFSTALIKANLALDHELVIRSDNGPQMTSKQFYNYLITKVQHQIEHEFIPCGTPNKNAHVESFYSIVEREFINLYYFRDIKDVWLKFSKFLNFYNNVRVHSSLRFRTPSEVLELERSGNLPPDIKAIKI